MSRLAKVVSTTATRNVAARSAPALCEERTARSASAARTPDCSSAAPTITIPATNAIASMPSSAAPSGSRPASSDARTTSTTTSPHSHQRLTIRPTTPEARPTTAKGTVSMPGLCPGDVAANRRRPSSVWPSSNESTSIRAMARCRTGGDDVKVTKTYFMLMVDDMDRATTFYQKAFDLSGGFVSPEWSELSWRDATIAFHGGRGGDERRPTGLGFEVEDLDAACAEVTHAGGTIVTPPSDRAGEGIRLAEVADPEGNVLSVAQRI